VLSHCTLDSLRQIARKSYPLALYHDIEIVFPDSAAHEHIAYNATNDKYTLCTSARHRQSLIDRIRQTDKPSCIAVVRTVRHFLDPGLRTLILGHDLILKDRQSN